MGHFDAVLGAALGKNGVWHAALHGLNVLGMEPSRRKAAYFNRMLKDVWVYLTIEFTTIINYLIS
uniref:Uncharacterized protein n=1 Tax=uncultured bacterium contig00021 TaxID=1181511 RepID=A0A806KSF3_9BACT|nr:hypothetical protein [uncultured bacterium contig00021]